MSEFTDQVIMVTGASGNLGRAVVGVFAAAGARVIVPDRSAHRLNGLFPELAASDKHYLASSTDITDQQSVVALVNESLARLGKIDVLVNTAGGYKAGSPPHETSLETWDFMLNLNARATFLVSQAVVPSMIERRRGRIINTAARSALGAGANEVAYAASKSAVARITESFSAAYKQLGINVNAVMPGTIDTPQNRDAMPNADTSRWVTPAAIGEVIKFLASDAAAPVHGALLPVYGLS